MASGPDTMTVRFDRNMERYITKLTKAVERLADIKEQELRLRIAEKKEKTDDAEHNRLESYLVQRGNDYRRLLGAGGDVSSGEDPG